MRLPAVLEPSVAVLAICSPVPGQVGLRPLSARVYTDGGIVPLRQPRGQWFAPDRVQRIEVAASRIPPREVLEAWIGDMAFPFTADPHKPVQTLVVTERMRDAWQEHGTLIAGYATQRRSGGELVLRAGLRELALPEGGVTVTLAQRTTAEVEHTGGFLRLRIDDITAGQVLLDLQGADGRTFIPRRSVRPGDLVEFDLGDARYVLEVRGLVNLLIGKDHGTFVLHDRMAFARDRIEALLDRVAAADVVFVREGREYDGPEAAAHLRGKYLAARDRITSLEQFIEQVGSRSSTTGSEYRIRRRDGTGLSAGTWLREQAAELAARDRG